MEHGKYARAAKIKDGSNKQICPITVVKFRKVGSFAQAIGGKGIKKP
jgi:hypothetical protein